MVATMRPLVPPYIEALIPYPPGKPIEETEREYGVSGVIKLASNENPLGPSPLAVQAIEAEARKLNLYPDGSSYQIIHRLAEFMKVAPNQIFVGNGSNEIIELIVKTFTTPEDEGLLCKGSFLMYKLALQSQGRRFTEVPMKTDYGYDLEAMAERLGVRTRVVFLANPDNPTGTAFSRSDLERFLAKLSPECLVVLDEAYFEYVNWAEYPNGMDYLADMPNLIVLRTFSKIYGLAGIRLGYGIMQPQLSGYLHRTRMPFNLSSLAQAAGSAALDDLEHVRTTRETTLRGLRFLEQQLPALGAQVPKSHANFVFADFGRPAQPIYEQLLRRGVITRPLPNYGFPNALRISVGLSSQNERLVAALKQVL